MIRQIFPGIYSIGKADLDNSHPAVVGVHLYFDKPKNLTADSAEKIVDFYHDKLKERTEELKSEPSSLQKEAKSKSELGILSNEYTKALKNFVYMSKLEKLVKTNEGPIIVLESSNSFHHTIARITKLGREHDCYFIKTHPANPDPLDMEPTELFAFLSFFAHHPIQLIGGYYWEDCTWPGGTIKRPWGCLGYTEYQFHKNQIPYEVIKEITFA
jgi:hypothetical protein